MYVQRLKENLVKFIELRNELSQLKPNQRLYNLHDYIDVLQECINSVDHGDGDLLGEPARIACSKLDDKRDLDQNKFVTAFATQKRALLSIADRYIRDLQLGLSLHGQVSK